MCPATHDNQSKSVKNHPFFSFQVSIRPLFSTEADHFLVKAAYIYLERVSRYYHGAFFLYWLPASDTCRVSYLWILLSRCNWPLCLLWDFRGFFWCRNHCRLRWYFWGFSDIVKSHCWRSRFSPTPHSFEAGLSKLSNYLEK